MEAAPDETTLAALLASDLVSSSEARPAALPLLPPVASFVDAPSVLVGPHLLQVEDVVDSRWRRERPAPIG